MDTKPTSSSALKARILLDSCTGRLPSDSLMEEMEKALDHAKKFTITMDDVFLGEGNFTPPTVDEMSKSLEVVSMGVRGCPFCEHVEAIRRGMIKLPQSVPEIRGRSILADLEIRHAAFQMAETIFPKLNIPPGTMSFSLDKGIMHEFKRSRSRPLIIWDSYAAAITEKPIYRIPEYHRSKKNFFSKPDPGDIRPRKLLTGKQKAKRSAKNKMQKISRMNNRRK